MPRIILIETSTALCSTALIEGSEITSRRESTQPRAHASMTAVYVKEMLDERGLKVSDCDAVCLSSGPGSYTGLRVGSSSAKGLCFGAGIPLISVGTLDVLVWQAIAGGLVPEGCTTVIPLIDARRMEVYSAIYRLSDSHRTIQRLSEINPAIIDAGSFEEEVDNGPVLFIGDGADKCREVITSPNAHFVQTCPKAEAMLAPALEAWDEKRFDNTAYFEPFYLKDFVATVSRKKLF